MLSSSNPHAVVIAGSLEDIRALTRLINILPRQFSVPVVASVHGSCEDELKRIIYARTRIFDRSNMVYAVDGGPAHLGWVYVVPAAFEVVFAAKNLLNVKPSLKLHDGEPNTSADRLFDSAAKIYGDGAIGVVLDGMGRDGMKELRAITEAGGTRVVQSLIESSHLAMPTHALLGDHVEFSVLFDDMGTLLSQLVYR